MIKLTILNIWSKKKKKKQSHTITILFHLSLHAPQSFVKCLSWVISQWHQVSLLSDQHNSPHSLIMHSLQCESEERPCTAPTRLLPCRCHWVPTHHRGTRLILYAWWTGHERWMDELLYCQVWWVEDSMLVYTSIHEHKQNTHTRQLCPDINFQTQNNTVSLKNN